MLPISFSHGNIPQKILHSLSWWQCSLHANAFSSTVNSSVIIIKMSRCCTGFYSNVKQLLSQLPAVVIMHDDICCCCKVKGNCEKRKAAWRLTLVTTSVLAPARQR